MMIIPEPDLSYPVITLLGGASFVGSFITAAMGVGGGAFALVVMAMVLPPAALIPIHAVVQLASNGGRVVVLRQFVNKNVVIYFTLGAALGTFAASFMFFNLPEKVLQTIILLGALLMTWCGAKTPLLKRRYVAALGALTSFLGVFIGATGLLVAPSLRAMFPKRQVVIATHAAAMSAQHALKLAVFGTAGFMFGPYGMLLLLMVFTGFVGTLAGRYLVLERLSERGFTKAFKLFMTLLVAIAGARIFFS